MSLQTMGKQVNQDPGDLISFGSEPQGPWILCETCPTIICWLQGFNKATGLNSDTEKQLQWSGFDRIVNPYHYSMYTPVIFTWPLPLLSRPPNPFTIDGLCLVPHSLTHPFSKTVKSQWRKAAMKWAQSNKTCRRSAEIWNPSGIACFPNKTHI